jgi:hypothetical protein
MMTFPDILQRLVQLFEPPEHRKFFALFLIDLNIKIISTDNIPCRRNDLKQMKMNKRIKYKIGDVDNFTDVYIFVNIS